MSASACDSFCKSAGRAAHLFGHDALALVGLVAVGLGQDVLQVFRVARGHQPQHQEQAHQRQAEVGEGDLPGAAVIVVVLPAGAALDDGLLMLVMRL
jgi:hypothetical protein